MKRLTALLLAAALLCPLASEAKPRGGQGPGMGGCCLGPGGAPMARRHGMKMRGGGRGGMRMEMASKLELTDEQKTKMERIRTDFQLLMVDQQAKVRKGQIQLNVLMRDDKAAATAVEAQIDQVAKFRAEIAKLRYRHHAEVQSILTEKQKEMLRELREKRPGERRGMMFQGDDDDENDDENDDEDDEKAPEPDGEED